MKIEQKINLNRFKFRFFTITLILSIVLFNSSLSYAKPLSNFQTLAKDVETNSLMNPNPPSDIDYALRLSVSSGKDYFTSGYTRNKTGKIKRDKLVEIYKNLVLLLQDLNFNLAGYPSYLSGLNDMGSEEIENLINKGILEANSYIQQEEEKEKQKNFYSKYISLVNKIYEEEKIDTFGEICELIKINKNQVNFKECKMPSDCYQNYKNTSKAVYDCLGKTLPLTCDNIFEYYPAGKLLALQKLAGIIIKDSKYSNMYYGYNVSEFCETYPFLDLSRFREILARDYHLDSEEIDLYATNGFIEGCARQLMGKEIDNYCKNFNEFKIKNKKNEQLDKEPDSMSRYLESEKITK